MKYYYILSFITLFFGISNLQGQENTCATATTLSEGTFSGTLGDYGAPNYEIKKKYFVYTPSTTEKWLLKIQGTRNFNTYINMYIPASVIIESGTCSSKTQEQSISQPNRDSGAVVMTFKAGTSYILSITSTDKYKFTAVKSTQVCTAIQANVSPRTTTAQLSLQVPSNIPAWSYAAQPQTVTDAPTYILSIDKTIALASLTPNTAYNLYILPYNCSTPYKFTFKTVGCKYGTGVKLDTVSAKSVTLSMDSTAEEVLSDSWKVGYAKMPVSGTPNILREYSILNDRFAFDYLQGVTQYAVYVRNDACSTWSAQPQLTFTTKSTCDFYPKSVTAVPTFTTGKKSLFTAFSWNRVEASNWNYKIVHTANELATAPMGTVALNTSNNSVNFNNDTISLGKPYYVAVQPTCSDKTADWKLYPIDLTNVFVPNDKCANAIEILKFPFKTTPKLGYSTVDKASSCTNFYDVTDLGDRFYKFKAASSGTLSATVLSTSTGFLSIGYATGNCSKPVTACNMVTTAYTPSGSIEIGPITIQKDSTYYIIVNASEFNSDYHASTGSLEISITSDASILEVQDTKIQTGILCSPNPFADELSIDLSSVPAAQSLELIDAMGIVVIAQTLPSNNGVYNINGSSLKPGMYVLKIQTPSGIALEKIVKQ